jgi:hypothetical protein
MRVAVYVARIKAMRNANKILVGMLNIPFIFAGVREFGCQLENWSF